MRKIKIALASFLCGAFFISCTTEKFKNFDNSYSYKLSGTVTVQATEYVNATDEEKDQFEVDGKEFPQLTLTMKPDEGQLRLIDRGKGNVYLSFNSFLSNVTLTEAGLEGMQLDLKEDQHKLVKFEEKGLQVPTYDLELGGSGTIYKNAIIFDLDFGGEMRYEDQDMTIISSEVECVAIKNE